jgi:hypothetical protein
MKLIRTGVITSKKESIAQFYSIATILLAPVSTVSTAMILVPLMASVSLSIIY